MKIKIIRNDNENDYFYYFEIGIFDKGEIIENNGKVAKLGFCKPKNENDYEDFLYYFEHFDLENIFSSVLVYEKYFSENDLFFIKIFKENQEKIYHNFLEENYKNKIKILEEKIKMIHKIENNDLDFYLKKGK